VVGRVSLCAFGDASRVSCASIVNEGGPVRRGMQRLVGRGGVRLAAVVMAALAGITYLVWPGSAAAASATRINAGGSSVVVGSTKWAGCATSSSCGGMVSGGNPWRSTDEVQGIVAPASQQIEQTEWTGGEASGGRSGEVAFTFTVPVVHDSTNQVKLHFNENAMAGPGQRVFDVRINGSVVLDDFDIFEVAGGAHKAITTSFTVPDDRGKIKIEFVAKVQNAKVNGIEIISGKGASAPPPVTDTITPSTLATAATGNVQWSATAASPKASAESTGGAIGNKIYAFGGYINNVWVGTTGGYAYDTTTNTWQSVASVPRPITHAASAVDGRTLILAGGYTANGKGGQTFAINNVWRYDPARNSWSSLPSLPAARGSGAMTVVGRALHFMGGVDVNRKEKGDHWTLDLDNVGGGWHTATPFPHPRTHFAAVTVGSSIYCIGGLWGIDEKSTELGDVYRFDTVTKTWSTKASMPVPTSHLTSSTFQYQGRIWVLGGETKFGVHSKNVFVYDPKANVWTRGTSLPAPRFSAVAAPINGSFTIVTGDQKSGVGYKGKPS
jgi:N-acetylneuraminic acid mutarotase